MKKDEKKRLKIAFIITSCLFFAISFSVIGYVVKTCYFISLVPHSKTTENLDLRDQYLFNVDDIYQFKNLKSIDLRGKKIEQAEIDKLKKAYPDAQIYWDVKIGEEYFDSESTALMLHNVEAAELNKLSFFRNLESVAIKDSTYTDELAVAIEEFGDIVFSWELNVCGTEAMSDAQTINLSNREIDIETLLVDLKQFKNLNEVNVDGCGLSFDDMLYLSQNCEAAFIAKVDLDGVTIDTSAGDFTVPEDMDENTVRKILTVMRKLSVCNMESSSIKSDEIKKFADQYPNILLVWNLEMPKKGKVSTASEELELGKAKIYDFGGFKKNLSYFRRLKKVDLCDSTLTNVQMEELCEAYPDVKFVWRVRLGLWTLKTDDIAFSTGYPVTYSPKKDPETGEELTESLWLSKSELEVLKYCTDLEALDLGHRGIKDISVIGELQKLKILILADNHISDITPLANLKNLVYVELFINRITDFSPLLSSKDTLLDLNIAWNAVKDPSVFCQLSKLERLWIAENPVAKNKESLEQIKNALTNCQFDTTSQNSTGGGWRKHERYYWMRDYFGLYYME